jgi:hypothetical protein
MGAMVIARQRKRKVHDGHGLRLIRDAWKGEDPDFIHQRTFGGQHRQQ